RDVNNGAMDVFNLQNAQIASARQIAAIGTEWSVVGIGDFDGNAADTDVVTRDSQNGAFEFYVFRNETMVSASQIASVGTDWQAVGIASYQSAAAAIASSASSEDNTDAIAPLGSDLLATGLPAPFIAGQFGGVETQAAPAAEVPSLSIGGSGTAQMLSASLFHPA